MKKKLISSGAVQIFGFVFGGWLFITSIKLQVKINGDVRKKISRQKKSQLDRNNSKSKEKVDFKRCGVDFWLGFRWPTFNYLDQTTRQDQWGREKKNSVGLPKPAFFFRANLRMTILENICSTIESCLPWVLPLYPTHYGRPMKPFFHRNTKLLGLGYLPTYVPFGPFWKKLPI